MADDETDCAFGAKACGVIARSALGLVGGLHAELTCGNSLIIA